MSTSTDHVLVCRAKRTGGAANTDFQLRLYDRRNATVISTLTAGVGTALGYYETTTFTTANIPTNDSDLEVQYYATAGVSGTVHDVSWWAKENSGVTFVEPFSPTLWWEWGHAPGVNVDPLTNPNVRWSSFWYVGYSGDPLYFMVDPLNPSTQSSVGFMWDSQSIPVAKCRMIVHADGTGSTGLQIGFISDFVDLGQNTRNGIQILQTYLVPMTGGDAYYALDGFVTINHPSIIVACKATTFGSAKLYSIGLEVMAPLPVR